MVESFTFSLSFYAFATALTVGVLLLNLIFSNKISALSAFSAALFIYVFTVISGRGLYFAELFQIISSKEEDLARNIIFSLLGMAGTTLIWFLLRKQPDATPSKLWIYICSAYAIFSAVLFGYHVVNL